MSAKLKLPNVRRLFLPDPGFILVEADLEGADAQTAAREIGGQFERDFFAGELKHTETMKVCYPDKFIIAPKLEPYYTKCKNMLYGTVYVGSPRGIASSASIPEPIVRRFQSWWLPKYPEIKEWHRRVEFDLQTTRTVSNPFGYRVHYFDRIEGLLPEAVNWKCQSNTACVCQRGKIILFREFADEVQLLLDIHDSLVFQIPIRDADRLLPKIRARLDAIEIPYPRPLRIPWSFKWSRESWGDCRPVEWARLAA